MTFLYDIGRVLLDFDFENSLDRLFPEGVEDRDARMARMIDRKDDFEAGRIEVKSYIDWALATLESPATSDEFTDAWQQIFTVNVPMWTRVRQLAADGHRLILFSNTNALHCPWIFDEFPEFALFHEAVLSYETGFIKPQPEIYQYAIDTYSLVPSETLYIDDLLPNIVGGREFGFRCFQYDLNDHAAFEIWLSENLKSQI